MAKKKYRFRVLRGKHNQKVQVLDDKGNPRIDKNGKPVMETERLADGTIKMYIPGDIIETDKDLVELFNRPGCIKFERLENSMSPLPSGSVSRQPPNFNQMTERQLRDYADSEEIDISGAKNKDDVLKLLTEARRVPA